MSEDLRRMLFLASKRGKWPALLWRAIGLEGTAERRCLQIEEKVRLLMVKQRLKWRELDVMSSMWV
jgi:hypothetical protein